MNGVISNMSGPRTQLTEAISTRLRNEIPTRASGPAAHTSPRRDNDSDLMQTAGVQRRA